MSHSPRFFPLLAILLNLMSCASARISRDGFVLGEKQWLKDEQHLRARAAFDLDCSETAIEFRVLSEYFDYRKAGSVGASGCGNRMVYVRTPTGIWIANSGTAK